MKTFLPVNHITNKNNVSKSKGYAQILGENI